MAQQNIGVTIVVSLICGLLGGIVGGLMAPAILGGMLLGAAAEVSKEMDATQVKIDETVLKMRAIGRCCEAYKRDIDRYPDARDIVTLSLRLEPTYTKRIPYEDAWGKRFLVSSGRRRYEIMSAGPDGRMGTADDLVFVNGTLVQSPGG